MLALAARLLACSSADEKGACTEEARTNGILVVRDSAGGASPCQRGDVRALVLFADGREREFLPDPTIDGCVVDLGAVNPGGSISITITASGFQTWSQVVPMGVDHCGHLVSGKIEARMVSK